MNRFISIEPDKCIGCGTCQAACSESHVKAGLQSTPRLELAQTREISAAVTCHHCEGAPCLSVCPVNAIEKRNDSVVVNEQICIGCKLCAIACPFGAIHPSGTSGAGVAGVSFGTPTYPSSLSTLLRWEIGVKTCAVKCDLCEHDPNGPACVAACPTAALSLVDGKSIDSDTRVKRAAAAEGLADAKSSRSRIEGRA
ncbi:MAG: 4Fe-4S dicluster domain-containing protein [Coriobacteriales bacterium]|jgi:hydrogenase-4 component A|nr:4Fe-4S dicluster domain-containing protein [Coriobacteriales bacterium]